VVELGPNTAAVDVIEAMGRVDRLRAIGVSVGSEESAPRTLAAVWDGFAGLAGSAGQSKEHEGRPGDVGERRSEDGPRGQALQHEHRAHRCRGHDKGDV
jgi:hypothetical protein